MAQRGRALTTGSRIAVIRTASWHFAPSQCLQPHSMQVAAARKTSVGFAGAAAARISGVAGSAFVR